MSALEHALLYVDLGWHVFPCKPDDKRPLTPHGFKDATTDPARIREWFAQWPDANLAAATGAASGFVALDVDKKDGAPGFESLHALEQEHGALPATMASQTPSGGKHFLFAHPGRVVKNSASLLAPGIDIRGDGGYVVTPPSLVNGKRYMWTREVAIAPLPAWLLDLIVAPKNATGGSQFRARFCVPQGERNNYIFRLACSLRARGVLYDQARKQVLDQAAKCDPPLDPVEALGIIEGAYMRYPEGGALHLTDWGNAQRLVLQHGDTLRHCFRMRKWFLFDGVRWNADEGAQIVQCAKNATRALYDESAHHDDDAKRSATAKWAAASESEKRVRATIELSKSEPGIPVGIEELDAHPWLLGVRNGVLDLRTGELRDARPEDLITKQAGVAFDPDAKCALWEKFLRRILPNPPVRDFMQRALGYGLTGDTREQCLFLLHGTGANGKSVLLRTVQGTLGDYATQTPAETWMTRDRSGANSDIARLRGARLVATVEVEDGQRLAESLVKQMTGQDTMAARFLYGEYFEFLPQFKLLLAANHKPRIVGTDHAIWRRVRMIPFLETIPSEEQDKELSTKLLAETSGILNWMLTGCLEWQRIGLAEPEAVKAATQNYRDEMDTVAQFVAERCLVEKHARVAFSAIYEAFKVWADADGVRHMSKTALGRRLTERGFEKSTLNGGYRGYCGLRLLEVYEK